MNRIRAATPSDLENAIDSQIRLDRRSRTESIRFIGVHHMQRITVCVRIHCDRRNTQLAACPKQPQCDFASVGDQNLANRGHQSRILNCEGARHYSQNGKEPVAGLLVVLSNQLQCYCDGFAPP